MTEMMYLARSRSTAIWGLLIAATLLSWWLGVHELGFVSGPLGGAGTVIILVAFIKVRFVGMYFMELLEAPTPLRVLMDAYCLVVGGILIGLLLV